MTVLSTCSLSADHTEVAASGTHAGGLSEHGQSGPYIDAMSKCMPCPSFSSLASLLARGIPAQTLGLRAPQVGAESPQMPVSALPDPGALCEKCAAPCTNPTGAASTLLCTAFAPCFSKSAHQKLAEALVLGRVAASRHAYKASKVVQVKLRRVGRIMLLQALSSIAGRSLGVRTYRTCGQDLDTSMTNSLV